MNNDFLTLLNIQSVSTFPQFSSNRFVIGLFAFDISHWLWKPLQINISNPPSWLCADYSLV